MGRQHSTEEQIAFALRQAESGTPAAELIRKLGVSEQTFDRWKKQFAGLGVAELRRLRTLEEENRKLVPAVWQLWALAMARAGYLPRGLASPARASASSAR